MRMHERYPHLDFLPIPETDERKPRPRLETGADNQTHTVRWGDGETATFEHGEGYFKSAEDVLRFSPLAKADWRDWPHVVVNWDYSSEEVIYRHLRKGFPEAWGDRAPLESHTAPWFYSTLFMWPLLTFGWELFLEVCLDPAFARIMDEFAEINRRVFRAFARLPVNFVVCHDDITTSRGPVCSPAWMHKYIFPRYEEYWSILKGGGKRVIFVSDGCLDQYADDVMACGACGIMSEPYTDYKRLARKYKDCFLMGEGDNRVLMRNQPGEIEAMVRSMAETGNMSRGYTMCIGNHIPWNVPGEAVKRYLDLSEKLAWRNT